MSRFVEDDGDVEGSACLSVQDVLLVEIAWTLATGGRSSRGASIRAMVSSEYSLKSPSNVNAVRGKNNTWWQTR